MSPKYTNMSPLSQTESVAIYNTLHMTPPTNSVTRNILWDQRLLNSVGNVCLLSSLMKDVYNYIRFSQALLTCIVGVWTVLEGPRTQSRLCPFRDLASAHLENYEDGLLGTVFMKDHGSFWSSLILRNRLDTHRQEWFRKHYLLHSKRFWNLICHHYTTTWQITLSPPGFPD